MPAKITRKGTAELWGRDIPVYVGRNALTRGGETLAKHARKVFKASGKSVTGSIMNSIVASSAYKSGDVWKVRVGPLHPAARFVIHGRRKGAKRPPIQTILNWIEARGITPNKVRGKNAKSATQGLAWAIATAIARDGIPAFPFMKIAFNEVKTKVRDQIIEDIRKGLRKR